VGVGVGGAGDVGEDAGAGWGVAGVIGTGDDVVVHSQVVLPQEPSALHATLGSAHEPSSHS
jgi:hypothetical protein